MEEQVIIAPEKERSAFLTTLCVLTFAFVPTFLALNIMAWSFVQTMTEQVQSSMAMMEAMSEDAGESARYLEKSMDGVNTANFTIMANIVCALLCFFGAFQMWRLKKTGYYIYLIGEIIPVLLSFYTLGQMDGLKETTMYLIPLMVVPAATMVVMYSLNLKEMK